MRMVTYQVVMNRGCERTEQSGFTLFELLIVMSIAALAIGTTLSLYTPGKSSVDIKAATYKIASAINIARSKAITGQKEVRILFNLAERKITFSDVGKEIRVAENMDITVTSAANETRSKEITGIRFFPNGRSTGGTVKLKQNGQNYEIRINWLTGGVSTHNLSGQKK